MKHFWVREYTDIPELPPVTMKTFPERFGRVSGWNFISESGEKVENSGRFEYLLSETVYAL
jgi:hypothetical protein